MKRFWSWTLAVIIVLMIVPAAFAGPGVVKHSGASGLGLLSMLAVGMVINEGNLAALFKGFKTIFNDALNAATPAWPKVAMFVSSTTAVEIYAWLEAFPAMREWVGDREIANAKAQDWTIKNKDWEVTVAVPRNSILDDQYSVYGKMFQSAGASVVYHPDEIVYPLLTAGFVATCYDGKAFFATDHAFGSNKSTKKLTAEYYGDALSKLKRIKKANGQPLYTGGEKFTLVVPPELESAARHILNDEFISVAGGSTQNNIWRNSAELQVAAALTNASYWFITVEKNGLQPLVYQERQKAEFQAKTDPNSSDHVFMKKEYVYGADSRDNAGYGLPQLAFGSTGADA